MITDWRMALEKRGFFMQKSTFDKEKCQKYVFLTAVAVSYFLVDFLVAMTFLVKCSCVFHL